LTQCILLPAVQIVLPCHGRWLHRRSSEEHPVIDFYLVTDADLFRHCCLVETATLAILFL
jgi:hypothetical protein